VYEVKDYTKTTLRPKPAVKKLSSTSFALVHCTSISSNHDTMLVGSIVLIDRLSSMRTNNVLESLVIVNPCVFGKGKRLHSTHQLNEDKVNV